MRDVCCILVAVAFLGCAAQARPLRIASLNPCLDSILVQVADPDQIIAISHYSHDPTATSIPLDIAQKYPAIMDTAEEVIALRPDLVLAGEHTSRATRNALARLNISVLLSAVPQTIAESQAQILEIGRAAGHPDRADLIANKIKALYSKPYTGKHIPALIRDNSGLVPGKNTLIDEVLSHTGFDNIATEYGVSWWGLVPLEILIAHPPAVLLTDTRASSRFMQHRGAQRLVHHINMQYFPRRLLNCAGPTLIEATVHLMSVREALQ